MFHLVIAVRVTVAPPMVAFPDYVVIGISAMAGSAFPKERVVRVIANCTIPTA
jgi:hypothetical protein